MIDRIVVTRNLLLLALLLCAFGALAAGDEDVAWIADSRGCKVANPFPQPGETIEWSGTCKNGFADGDGVLKWFVNGTPSDRYDGTLRQGWAEGNGTLLREAGRYVGEWKRSLQDGKGRYDAADGSWYEGEWQDGQPHGYGQYQAPDGRLFSGTWEKGEYQGELKDNPNRT
ncbi:MAG: hypothetical protein ACT4PQ_13535 [Betaproteobacteria bacterium]